MTCYYELRVKWAGQDDFGCEFGSYDRAEVLQEQKDVLDMYPELCKDDTKIVKTS